MKVIGIRKMAVVMWCAGMIAMVMCFYICYDQKLDLPSVTGLTLIAGLGGFHSYKQGQTDAIANTNGVK